MERGRYIDAEERQKIVDLLHEHGGNRYLVARIAKRAPGSIQKIANEEGIPSAHSAPKKAIEAHQENAKADRQHGIDLIKRVGATYLEKLEDLEPTPENVRAYKDAALGYAIGVDKDRLESGEVTDRTESRRAQDLKQLMADSRQAAEEWSE